MVSKGYWAMEIKKRSGNKFLAYRKHFKAMAQSTNKSDFLMKKTVNKFKTKRGLKRKILRVEVNDEGNGKKTKKLSRPEFIFNVVLS